MQKADNPGRLTVQKGKNQTEPETVPATARDLGEIRPEDAAQAARAFGLTGEALANRARAGGPGRRRG